MKKRSITQTSAKRRPRGGIIEATAQCWAANLDTDQRTLVRRLTVAGIRLPRKGAMLPAADVLKALISNPAAERARVLRLQGDLLERQNRLEERSTVHWDWVLNAVNQRYINPSIAALETCKDTEWVEKVYKPIIQQHITNTDL